MDILDAASNAPPGALEPGRVALAVYAERGVFGAFDHEVSSLVTVGTERLDGEGLVEIIFLALVLVRVVDHVLDRPGGLHCPQDQGAEKIELEAEGPKSPSVRNTFE